MMQLSDYELFYPNKPRNWLLNAGRFYESVGQKYLRPGYYYTTACTHFQMETSGVADGGMTGRAVVTYVCEFKDEKPSDL